MVCHDADPDLRYTGSVGLLRRRCHVVGDLIYYLTGKIRFVKLANY
ncbi:hypothetical protein DFR59_102130 [Falsibacillus pallidus]|uniref:Uncharacterized protein n=1 Tax=Falsibacillus pallidus TaxID=493781 RepID=A0A370GP36_9BACI|nr:hypothetical protein DFR59_102130 [Falsibacillus pallidus]